MCNSIIMFSFTRVTYALINLNTTTTTDVWQVCNHTCYCFNKRWALCKLKWQQRIFHNLCVCAASMWCNAFVCAACIHKGTDVHLKDRDGKSSIDKSPNGESALALIAHPSFCIQKVVVAAAAHYYMWTTRVCCCSLLVVAVVATECELYHLSLCVCCCCCIDHHFDDRSNNHTVHCCFIDWLMNDENARAQYTQQLSLSLSLCVCVCVCGVVVRVFTTAAWNFVKDSRGAHYRACIFSWRTNFVY